MDEYLYAVDVSTPLDMVLEKLRDMERHEVVLIIQIHFKLPHSQIEGYVPSERTGNDTVPFVTVSLQTCNSKNELFSRTKTS